MMKESVSAGPVEMSPRPKKLEEVIGQLSAIDNRLYHAVSGLKDLRTDIFGEMPSNTRADKKLDETGSIMLPFNLIQEQIASINVTLDTLCEEIVTLRQL
jgi:hypothetical protein